MAKDQSSWLAGVLLQHDEVTLAERIGPQLVRVERKAMPPAIIGVISADPVCCSDFDKVLGSDPRPEFILNIPNSASWTGEAIDDLEARGVAFGKMNDLYRGLTRDEDISGYRNPQRAFVERLLEQHRNVIAVERITDNAYRLHRLVGDDIVVALTDAYEVTADEVRTAFAQHAPFDVLLKNNPYGRISQQGAAAAVALGIVVHDQRSINAYLAG